MKFCFQTFINDINKDFDLEYEANQNLDYNIESDLVYGTCKTLSTNNKVTSIKEVGYKEIISIPKEVLVPYEPTKRVDFYDFIIVLQNIQGIKDDLKLEIIIKNMILNDIDTFMIQEIQKVENSIKTIRDHIVFYYGLSNHVS